MSATWSIGSCTIAQCWLLENFRRLTQCTVLEMQCRKVGPCTTLSHRLSTGYKNLELEPWPMLLKGRPLHNPSNLWLQWAHGNIFHSHVDSEGILIYRKKALEFHRPKLLIWASEKPFAAAHEAAPILKLWDLYLETSRLQKLRAAVSADVKNEREIGEASGQQKRGPGKLSRRFKYASSNEAGQTGCSL